MDNVIGFNYSNYRRDKRPRCTDCSPRLEIQQIVQSRTSHRFPATARRAFQAFCFRSAEHKIKNPKPISEVILVLYGLCAPRVNESNENSEVGSGPWKKPIRWKGWQRSSSDSNLDSCPCCGGRQQRIPSISNLPPCSSLDHLHQYPWCYLMDPIQIWTTSLKR